MKLSKKLVALLSAGVMAFALFGMAGCSSESADSGVELTTEEINAQDIEVTAAGYTVMENETLCYAFTVENPNEGYVANSVTFTIEGYDENDLMVVGGGETIQEIYPGITTAAAGTAYLSSTRGDIARFEVKPLMTNILWTKTTETTEELENMFQISNTQVTENEGTMTITGSISAEMPNMEEEEGTALDNRKDAHLVAVLRDADGNILCGGSSLGIMLDPSMVPLSLEGPGDAEGAGVVPGTVDEEGNPIEPDDAELISGEPTEEELEELAVAEEGMGEGNMATTTFSITIPGVVSYATVDVYATPGI